MEAAEFLYQIVKGRKRMNKFEKISWIYKETTVAISYGCFLNSHVLFAPTNLNAYMDQKPTLYIRCPYIIQNVSVEGTSQLCQGDRNLCYRQSQ